MQRLALGRFSVIASSTYAVRGFDIPRQGNPETGAALGFGLCRAVAIDLAIMLFHGGIVQRKAQASPLAGVIGGVERHVPPTQERLGGATAIVHAVLVVVMLR